MKIYWRVFLVLLLILITFMLYMSNYKLLNIYEYNKIGISAYSQLKSQENKTFNYIISYPHLLECTINSSSGVEYRNDTKIAYNYSQPASSLTHLLRISRAIVVYFPIEKTDNFQSEFSWLYRSWIEMQKYEPNKWRTDIVVFINTEHEAFKNEDFFLKKLKCSLLNRRKSKRDKPMCSLVKYTPFDHRSIKNLSNQHNFILNNVNIFSENETNLKPFYASLKKITNYCYLDSILMAFEGWSYFKAAGYDFLIRSDMDVFLTPLFGMWLPKSCNAFHVGGGAYSNDFNVKRLKRVADNIGFKYAWKENLGSTWYSTPDQFRLVSYLTLFSMAYLSEEEFSQPEREGKLGVLLWPHWHYGVLLLYGQHLALNHLIATNQINVVKLDKHLDYPAHTDENIFKILHIHVFHTDDMFSKFQFKAGKYNEKKWNEMNTNTTKYFSLKMALESKRLSANQLAQLFIDESQKKI